MLIFAVFLSPCRPSRDYYYYSIFAIRSSMHVVLHCSRAVPSRDLCMFLTYLIDSQNSPLSFRTSSTILCAPFASSKLCRWAPQSAASARQYCAAWMGASPSYTACTLTAMASLSLSLSLSLRSLRPRTLVSTAAQDSQDSLTWRIRSAPPRVHAV